MNREEILTMLKKVKENSEKYHQLRADMHKAVSLAKYAEAAILRDKADAVKAQVPSFDQMYADIESYLSTPPQSGGANNAKSAKGYLTSIWFKAPELYHEKEFLEAMVGYARTQAIAFDKWKWEDGWMPYTVDRSEWYKMEKKKAVIESDTKLYDLFLEYQSKQKK